MHTNLLMLKQVRKCKRVFCNKFSIDSVVVVEFEICKIQLHAGLFIFGLLICPRNLFDKVPSKTIVFCTVYDALNSHS